jgi:acetoacetyl-CoA synthetase
LPYFFQYLAEEVVLVSKLLWEPSQDRINSANITKFIEQVNRKHGLNLKNYHELYKWSITNIKDFWALLWDFGSIVYSESYKEVLSQEISFRPETTWFSGSKLNFAENLLRYKDEHLAIVSIDEKGKKRHFTFKELNEIVTQLAGSLKKLGIKSGDRVVAYMPNIPETVIAMLATTCLGAIWSSCGSELGSNAVIDRFSQVEPRILFTSNGYYYKGKEINLQKNITKIVEGIPTLEKTIIIKNTESENFVSEVSNAIEFSSFLSEEKEISFEQLDFDHPLYIMFSSGTTGKPKCMTQSAGGVLINHLKELILHTDLKRSDNILYITSPSWMMWNWLVSSLAVGATVVLFDGNPVHPDWTTMWKLIDDEEITIFGCSASYINYLRTINASPRNKFKLKSLREISQTGSSLSEEGFEYVYLEIKQDLHFNSISGGTDINGCFAGGTPTLPVYAGELQAAGLAMKINSYDSEGNPVRDIQGELVCEVASPSMPIYFWNDKNHEKYKNAYFKSFPNKDVWCHGDYIKISSKTGGVTFFGRSDAILKPSGVRIGTSEIYRIVEQIGGIADSLAIGQDWKGDQRIILFVQLLDGKNLDDDLKTEIKTQLRKFASPRHVPAMIIKTSDIPYTFSGKKVEIAVTNIIHGRSVTNKDALRNPESLDFYEKIISKLKV